MADGENGRYEDSFIRTIEGIAADPKWNPLIDVCCKWDAMQCGSCTPGIRVTAGNRLDRNPNPTEQDCRQALVGNFCCCGTSPRHPAVIMKALSQRKGGA